MPISENASLYAFYLLKACCEDRFPAAYAQSEAAFDRHAGENPLPGAVYENLGKRLMETHRRPGWQGERYYKISKWILRLRKKAMSSSLLDKCSDAVWHLQRQCADSQCGRASEMKKLGRLFSEYVYQAASRKICGAPLDDVALEKAVANALDGFSVTDVRRAVMEWTTHIPLDHWLDTIIEGAKRHRLQKFQHA